ncbi:ABC-type transport system, involved in lipoprotein release, permease component [Eubacterium ruminantium]|nr:ABC-type transport system, involved in lipoprotein release, permease component [Eubacterium ruminantium]
MKILRLSIFNLKRHIKEAVILLILTAVSVAFLSVDLINSRKADVILDKAFRNSGSSEYIMYVQKDAGYKEEYGRVIEEDPRLLNLRTLEFLVLGDNVSITCRRDDGSESSLYTSFINEENERKLSYFKKDTTLSDDETAAMEHPVWLPYYLKFRMGFKAGENFTLIIKNQEYQFQVAGFYESALMSNPQNSFKCVVSDEDYKILSASVDRNIAYAFDVKDGLIKSGDDANKLAEEFDDKITGLAGHRVTVFSNCLDNKYIEAGDTADVLKMMMTVLGFIAAVVVLSSIVMIRHKITNDIEEQMESIGVLEALGYKSFEISMSYVYEYLILGLIGCAFGALITVLTDPFMTHLIRVFEGHKGSAGFGIMSIVIPALIILALIVLTAFLKARSIKKYPPVIAFRRGIRTHHFGRNRLPLEKASSRLNMRLGLREFLNNRRQNIGLFICILLSGLTIAFAVMVTDIFRDGGAAFKTCTGMEDAELMLTFEQTASSEEIINELYTLPEVRKATATWFSQVYLITQDKDGESKRRVQANCYKDFKETENIFVNEGRFPEHDNEIIIKKSKAEELGLEIGDSLILRGDGIEKSYIISGYVNIIGSNVFLTRDGLKRIDPATDFAINVFLKDKVNADEFEELIKSKYGSGRIRLRSISSVDELLEANIGGISSLSQIFAIIMLILVAIIVSVILGFLIDSTIRKQRKQLGIKKSMGYTSRDLRLQMVYRIMPIAVPSIIAGAFLAIPVTNIFMAATFGGGMIPRFLWLIPEAILLIGYVFVSAYLSAGKIKKVSVTELMTE